MLKISLPFHGQISREILALRMRNFQGVAFI